MIVKCNRCNGTGKEPLNRAAAIATLGLWTCFELIDRFICEKCDGDGHVSIKEKEK